MTTKYQIGQTVTFTTKIFGKEQTLTNTIHNVKKEDGKIFYSIGGVGQMLFGRDLKGKEDWFTVSENKINN